MWCAVLDLLNRTVQGAVTDLDLETRYGLGRHIYDLGPGTDFKALLEVKDLDSLTTHFQ